MLATILLVCVLYWIGYKSGRSYFNDVSPLFYAVCVVATTIGLCFWIGSLPHAVIGALFSGAWNAGVVVGILHERRAAASQ